MRLDDVVDIAVVVAFVSIIVSMLYVAYYLTRMW